MPEKMYTIIINETQKKFLARAAEHFILVDAPDETNEDITLLAGMFDTAVDGEVENHFTK